MRAHREYQPSCEARPDGLGHQEDFASSTYIRKTEAKMQPHHEYQLRIPAQLQDTPRRIRMRGFRKIGAGIAKNEGRDVRRETGALIYI